MAKTIEVVAEEWGKTNTVKYWVSGYTQASRELFSNKEELMVIFRGIADDYFSERAEPMGEPRTAEEWAKVMELMGIKKDDEEEK